MGAYLGNQCHGACLRGTRCAAEHAGAQRRISAANSFGGRAVDANRIRTLRRDQACRAVAGRVARDHVWRSRYQGLGALSARCQDSYVGTGRVRWRSISARRSFGARSGRRSRGKGPRRRTFLDPSASGGFGILPPQGQRLRSLDTRHAPPASQHATIEGEMIMQQPVWNFEQEPWTDERPDETSINLRAYFDRMPDEKMRQYS